MEYDLIALGYRLREVGTPALSWRDLAVIVRQSPRSSAIFRAVNPTDYQWGTLEMLTAAAVDALNLLVWFKTKDGAKNKNRPDPIPRPGIEPKVKRRSVTKMTIDELKKRIPFQEQ